MNYKFDPTEFGFLTPDKMPEPLKEVEAKYAFIKVNEVSKSNDGSFWYKSCYKIGCLGEHDDRWIFNSGLYDVTEINRLYWDNHTRYTIYSGCITSKEYAEMLLMHLMGTSTDEGTIKYGTERLKAKSLKIK